MATNRPQLENTAEFASPPALNGTALMASLTVKDLKQSLAWYADVVGFEVEQRMEHEGQLRAAAIKAGAVRMLLNQDDGGRGWDRVKGEGFSLTIVTNQRVDDIAKRIKSQGGTLDSEPADMPWGARMFRITDPDGYRLSISSIKKG